MESQTPIHILDLLRRWGVAAHHNCTQEEAAGGGGAVALLASKNMVPCHFICALFMYESLIWTEPWLGRWSWSLGPSPVNRPLEPGARVARLFFFPENSPYAHLKHLGLGPANDIGAL